MLFEFLIGEARQEVREKYFVRLSYRSATEGEISHFKRFHTLKDLNQFVESVLFVNFVTPDKP